jgi:hypothetical protein
MACCSLATPLWRRKISRLSKSSPLATAKRARDARGQTQRGGQTGRAGEGGQSLPGPLAAPFGLPVRLKEHCETASLVPPCHVIVLCTRTLVRLRLCSYYTGSTPISRACTAVNR